MQDPLGGKGKKRYHIVHVSDDRMQRRKLPGIRLGFLAEITSLQEGNPNDPGLR